MPKPFLYQLFQDTRASLKLSLGIAEYHALLEAVEKGQIIGNLEALQLACEIIWLKTEAQKIAFRRLFEQQQEEEMAAVLLFLQQKAQRAAQTDRPPQETTKVDTPQQQDTDVKEDDKAPNTKDETETLTQDTTTDGTSENTTEADAEVLLSLEEAEQGVALKEEQTQSESILSHPYILSDAYHPINERDMRQSWRFLRQPLATGLTNELNIQQTIRQFARDGFLSDVYYHKTYEDKLRLLLLIDYKGSMVAFHTLAQQLINTVQQEEYRRHIQVCYFHDVPKKHLFLNQARTKAIQKEKLLQQVSAKQTRVLIFSDAGAARGKMELARIDDTWDFVDELLPKVRQMVWLNPVPRKRWEGTTAEEIAAITPMFEINQQGFRAAIRHLRGKSA